MKDFVINCKYENDIVIYVNKLVDLLYEDLNECCGGMLHIVLDDGNLDDDDIQWCIDYCNEPENNKRHDKYICLEIAHKMLDMTMEQRRLIYYKNGKFECCINCQECVIEHDEDEY